MDFKSIRNEYEGGILTPSNLDKNPILQVKLWVDEAVKNKAIEATAMVVSTIDRNSFPQSRVVLLKAISDEGFSFFTNYNSSKGIDIQGNNKVSLLFFWPQLFRQVKITGIAHKVDPSISDEYFSSRPFDSQLSAIASDQSQEIISRQELEDEFNKLQKQYSGQAIPRPAHWGGYTVKPITIEIWQGRQNRLHDRFLYIKNNQDWNIKRLAP